MYFAMVLTFCLSFFLTKAIVYTAEVRRQNFIGLDSHKDAVQRMHAVPVPRIGGLAIFVSMVFTALYGSSIGAPWGGLYSALIMSSFFVFVGGIAEDLSGRITPAARMMFMVAAVIFTVYVLSSMNLIRNLEHETLNQVLHYDIIAFIITCFAVVGISNAYNMIDGYNGLSATSALVNIGGICYIAHMLGDYNIIFNCVMLSAAILGFLVINYPFGKIFLGDGGSYTIGFMISLISLNLIGKHIGHISPFTVLLLVVYPFTEAVFTIFRRKFIHRTKAMQPDCLHLHQLIFSRCFSDRMSLLQKNARVMPIMFIMMMPQVICVIIWYNNTAMILCSLLGYWIFYVYVYVMIVKFRVPFIFKMVAYVISRRYVSIKVK